MRFSTTVLLVMLSTAAMAEDAKVPANLPVKPSCTPPDEMVIKLPLARAVTLNNMLQDFDVVHREWREVAMDVRNQLLAQCKETQKK